MMENLRVNLPEDTPQNRVQQAERVVRFFEKTGFREILSDTEKKQELIATMDLEELISMLTRLNGIIIGLPPGDREIYTDKHDVLHPITKKSLHVGAPPEMQQFMLEKHLVEALPDVDSEYLPDFIASSINFIHLFPDGNGRLSRLIYFILSNESAGMDPEDISRRITELLEEHNGDYNFNPGIVYKYLDERLLKETPNLHFTNIPNMYKRAAAQLEAGIEVPDKYKVCIAAIMDDDPVTAVVASKHYVISRGHELETYLKGKENKSRLDSAKILNEMSFQPTAAEWIGAYENAKRWRYKVLVDMYTNPDEHIDEETGAPMRDLFRAYVFDNKKRLS